MLRCRRRRRPLFLARSYIDAVGLNPEFVEGCVAPFVGESRLKFSLEFRRELPIELNGTRMIISEMDCLIVDDRAIDDDGCLDLTFLSSAGISGLNIYYAVKKLAFYPPVRPNEIPSFVQKD